MTSAQYSESSRAEDRAWTTLWNPTYRMLVKASTNESSDGWVSVSQLLEQLLADGVEVYKAEGIAKGELIAVLRDGSNLLQADNAWPMIQVEKVYKRPIENENGYFIPQEPEFWARCFRRDESFELPSQILNT